MQMAMEVKVTDSMQICGNADADGDNSQKSVIGAVK